MRTLSLEVKPLVGSNTEDVFEDAIQLARHLTLMVTFNFNGVHCYVTGNDEVPDLERRYWDACERKLPTLPSR